MERVRKGVLDKNESHVYKGIDKNALGYAIMHIAFSCH